MIKVCTMKIMHTNPRCFMLNPEVTLEYEYILVVVLEILLVEINLLVEAIFILKEFILEVSEEDMVEDTLLDKIMLSILFKHPRIHHKLLEVDLLVQMEYMEVLEI